LTNVTIYAVTPPTLVDESVFYSNASARKFYVPSESVETYKSATNWRSYSYCILPIS